MSRPVSNLSISGVRVIRETGEGIHDACNRCKSCIRCGIELTWGNGERIMCRPCWSSSTRNEQIRAMQMIDMAKEGDILIFKEGE